MRMVRPRPNTRYDLTRLHDVQWAPSLQLHDAISETPSGLIALTAFNTDFVQITFPILPERGPAQWTPPLISFKQNAINPGLDMLPTGKFTIHTHPTQHDTNILCTLDGRAVTTLSGPRI
jgi:hypothetical protein